MELIENYNSLCTKIIDKYDENLITIGILVADYRQREAREYILNYLQRFDELSGKYIDFYIPGYYMYSKESKDEWKNREHFNICVSRHCSSSDAIYLDRTQSQYYFDGYLFDDFWRDFEKETDIKYTYNPMLILVEISKGEYRGKIKYQRKMIIELDDNTPRGCRRCGELFEAIFEIAKKEVHLDRFKKNLRMRYIKGNALHQIAGALDGNFIEKLEETTEEILRYKVR